MCIFPIPPHLTTEYDKMAHIFKVSEEAADYITSKFKKPMKLEFEKVYKKLLRFGVA
jgi:DNA polymerase elongation subunit (family B)